MNKNGKGDIDRWYLFINLMSYVLPIVFLVSIPWYLFYRPIEVTYEPWQVLDPGRAVEPLKFEVVQEGEGAVVEPGNLVQISLRAWLTEQKRIEDKGDYWIWVGFRTEKETPFHSISPRLVSAFVDLREGGGVKFLESPSKNIYAGHVYLNPFGDSGYSRRRGASGKSSESRMIYIPTSSGYTVVHIKKVFKGQLKYRTVHLYDDTWYLRCSWWRGETGGDGCKIIKNMPREGWVDEARFDGMSNDGKSATFQYGPVDTPGKKRGDIGWAINEWKKLPVGVQVK